MITLCLCLHIDGLIDRYTYHIFLIQWTDDKHFGWFQILVLINSATAVNVVLQACLWFPVLCSSLLGISLMMGLLNHMPGLLLFYFIYLFIKEIFILFPTVTMSVHQGVPCLHTLTSICYSLCFTYVAGWHCMVVFICTSLMASDVEHFLKKIHGFLILFVQI